ncbi:MAG: hypothetical protein M3T96_09400 [Acidobacteriota bacterium]|nr:hypothetical protein [Acidobacteriota bacterium]
MQNQPPERLEIFLALALKSGAGQAEDGTQDDGENSENAAATEAESNFPAVFGYLNEKETEKFRRLQAHYAAKTAAEKVVWQNEIRRKIGTDEQLIDDTVHGSYVSEKIAREIPAVQRIVFDSLSPEHRKAVELPAARSGKSFQAANALEKSVRRAFAKNFIARRDLPKPTAFDRLSGTQLVRLIRLTGIREVALACLQIEAVELVAAFLRRFSAEDAQAIAAQLNSLPEMSEARLQFAENLVQTTIEIESKPSAMLHLLGFNLIGIALCGGSEARATYTNQKLPLEVAARLPEIIEEHCRLTPEDLRHIISAEVEQTAQTLFRSGKKRPKS